MRVVNTWKYIYRKEVDVVDITLRFSWFTLLSIRYDKSDREFALTVFNFRFVWSW